MLNRLARLVTYLQHPEYFSLRRQGVYIPIYEALDKPWIRHCGFQLILDIGSHVGEFAGVARVLFPDAELHCFEPLPECVSALRQRFGNASNVVVHECAVSDSNGEAHFHRSSFSASSSLLEAGKAMTDYKPWIRHENSIVVASARLENLLSAENLDKKPIMIKVDVEGAADRVICGGMSFFQQADLVIVETDYLPLRKGQATFGSIFSTLTGLGLTYLGSLDQVLHGNLGFPAVSDSLFVSDGLFATLNQVRHE
jgi:FkbM family methyltransferase